MKKEIIEVDLKGVDTASEVIKKIYEQTGHLPEHPIYNKLGDGFIDYMRIFPKFEKSERPLEVHMVLKNYGEFSTNNKQLCNDLIDCLTFLTDKKGTRYDDIDFTFSVRNDD